MYVYIFSYHITYIYQSLFVKCLNVFVFSSKFVIVFVCFWVYFELLVSIYQYYVITATFCFHFTIMFELILIYNDILNSYCILLKSVVYCICIRNIVYMYLL